MSILRGVPKTKTTSSIIVIGLVLSFFLFTSFVDGKGQVIEEFETALQDEDIAFLKSNVISEDPALPINEQNMKMFIQFLNEDNRKEAIMNNLKENGESEFLSLKSSNSLINKYKIVIHPYYLKLLFPEGLKKLTLSNGAEYEVEIGEEEIIDIPVIPGSYRATAHYETDFLSFETSFNFDLIEGKIIAADDKRFLHRLKLGQVAILSQWQDTDFIINDSKVHDGFDLRLNPIPIDGTHSFSIKKKFPWGTFTSEEVTIEESKTYVEGSDFAKIDAVNDTLTKQIVSTMETYLNNWQSAITENKIELLTNVTGNFIPKAEVYLSSFERLNRELINYTIEKESITIFEDIRGNYIAYVTVNESLQEVNNIIYYEDRGYFLIYNNKTGSWILDVIQEAERDY
jgi:uncharacterized membrane protein YvbJ